LAASSASRNEQLQARAGFDLQCPKEQIEVTPIKQNSNAFHDDVLFTQVAGVRGCGKQLTYVYDEFRGVWVLNADSQPAKP
jgi:hypothetical protein